MNPNKDETEYTPMTVVGENEQTETPTTFAYYIIPTQPKKRKQCGGICCCLMFLTFFLCFFLIPRKPTVILDKLKIGDNETGYGTFVFYNNNYFDLSWKKSDISVYWLPYNGQTVGNVCYNQNNVCDSSVYVDSICAIKLGEFEQEKNFKSKSRSKKHKDIPLMKSTAQEIACTSWMLLNPYQGLSQRLMTTGHVLAESSFHNFGKINIPKEYYYLSL